MLVFQVPNEIPVRYRLQLRRRLYLLLRALGMKPDLLLKCGLDPMRVTGISLDRVRSLLGDAELLRVEPSPYTLPIESSMYYVTRT